MGRFFWGWYFLLNTHDLRILEKGGINAQRYLEDILEQNLKPFTLFIGKNFRGIRH